MENLRILILAAGKSTRMKSKYAKVLHRVGGRMLIEHVLRSARPISEDIWVVVGHTSDKVKASIPEVKFVDQREQLGSGHAVMTARDQFAEYTGDLLVLSGDVPLIAQTLSRRSSTFTARRGIARPLLQPMRTILLGTAESFDGTRATWMPSSNSATRLRKS